MTREGCSSRQSGGRQRRLWRQTWHVALCLVAILATGLAAEGCKRGDAAKLPAAGDRDADKFLFDRGTEELTKHHWLEAREYFRKLFDTYPTSPYRQDAKLGIGDSFIGEGQPASMILAANEFREFLQFFPLNPRADYAQYKLAVSQMKLMLAPQRDQTATHDAIREFDTFVRNYPSSALMADALKLQRECKDRLGDAEYGVGMQYYRIRWYPGAIARFETLLNTDPAYTRRDAVYYYLGEAYSRNRQTPDAIKMFNKLNEEFAVSEYREPAKRRLDELTP